MVFTNVLGSTNSSFKQRYWKKKISKSFYALIWRSLIQNWLFTYFSGLNGTIQSFLKQLQLFLRRIRFGLFLCFVNFRRLILCSHIIRGIECVFHFLFWNRDEKPSLEFDSMDMFFFLKLNVILTILRSKNKNTKLHAAHLRT